MSEREYFIIDLNHNHQATQGGFEEATRHAMALQDELARRKAQEPVAYLNAAELSRGRVSDEIDPEEHGPGMIAVWRAPLPALPPENFSIVPKNLTAENGAKAALLGEFTETICTCCTACLGDDEDCDGEGVIRLEVKVSWSNIKAIWEKAVEHFKANARGEIAE